MNLTGEKIIEAAINLFARKGYEATSIRDIAVEAGVTSSTLYHYIKTKEDLLLKIMKRQMERLLSLCQEVIPLFSKPEEQLAALVQIHVIEHGLYRLSALVTDTEFRALKGESRKIIGKIRDEYEAVWNNVLVAGVAQGVFVNIEHIEDIKFVRFALLQMCTGVAHWFSSEGPVSILDISLKFANMALALVGAKRNDHQLKVTDLNLPDVRYFYQKMTGGY